MKTKLIALSLAALVVGSNAFAKEIKVPFIRTTVPAEGLKIKYSLTGKDPQKVSCIFEGFYKGYLSYTLNNIETDSGAVFGDGSSADQFYFTSKGKNWGDTQGLDSLNQYRVDANGYVVVKDTPYGSAAYATCVYIPEDAK